MRWSDFFTGESHDKHCRQITGRAECTAHIVDYELSVSTVRRTHVGVPMPRQMPQKLACRMAMGKSARQEELENKRIKAVIVIEQ
jgi:hypothetical protein